MVLTLGCSYGKVEVAVGLVKKGEGSSRLSTGVEEHFSGQPRDRNTGFKEIYVSYPESVTPSFSKPLMSPKIKVTSHMNILIMLTSRLASTTRRLLQYVEGIQHNTRRVRVLSEFLPGFVHFQMSSQVRFYQIRVVF
jgi:hypothetical protein